MESSNNENALLFPRCAAACDQLEFGWLHCRHPFIGKEMPRAKETAPMAVENGLGAAPAAASIAANLDEL